MNTQIATKRPPTLKSAGHDAPTQPAGPLTFAGFLCLVGVVLMPNGPVWSGGYTPLSTGGWAISGLLLFQLALRGRGAVNGLLVLALLLLALPLVWMPGRADHEIAFLRTGCALLGGVLMMLMQGQPLTGAAPRPMARILVICGVLCTGMLVWQTWWPGAHGNLWVASSSLGRPAGVFHQVNVTSSFLATSLALALHLWLTGGRRLWPAVSLGVLSFGVILTQSTVGWLGMALAGLLLGGLAWPRRRADVLLSWGCITLGCGLAWLCRHGTGLAPVSHAFGRESRLQVWRACLALIREHPLLGQGYGTFEGILPHGMQLLGEHQMERQVFTYPHNEILYWVVEGGLVAGTGLLVLLVWGGLLVRRAWLSSMRAGGYGAVDGDAPGWVICALPILLHTQVEYPFYLSSVHFLVVVLLLGTASARLGVYRPRPWLVVRGMRWLLVPAGCLLGAGVMAYALTGAWVKGTAARSMQTLGTDTAAMERAVRFNPWFARDAVGYDRFMAGVQQYNQSKDARELVPLAAFLHDYLKRHPDPGAYQMYLSILRAQGDSVGYAQTLAEARWRVPWSAAFAPASADK